MGAELKEKQDNNEMNHVIQITRIASLETELKEREMAIKKMTNDIDQLQSEAEENKKQSYALTLEIEIKNSINESLIAENEDMKTDMNNKATLLPRCIETVHRTRDQMRILREKNRKLKEDK